MDSRSLPGPRFCRATLMWMALAGNVVPEPLASQAQTRVSVRGVIVSQEGNSPMVGAIVKLADRADSVRSASSGAFEILNVTPGRHWLRVTALGYSPWEQTIAVADTGWSGQVALVRLPQVLEEVSVTAAGLRPEEFAHTSRYDDFFRRRKLGQGTFRTRDDILKLGAPDLASALQGIPGVNITATSNPYGELEYRFRIARCPGQPPNLAIYINGIRTSHSGQRSQNRGSELSGFSRPRPGSAESSCEDCVRIADALSSVGIANIQFLEFYSGVGEMPSDLDRGDSCAAIVIWTR